MGQAEHDDTVVLAEAGMPGMSGRRRRSSDESDLPRRSRGRRRVAFFALAAMWGFLSGISAMLAALTLLERPVRLAPPIGVALAIAAVASIGGAFVIAAAYRETTRRRG
jgi:hypothetical protein